METKTCKNCNHLFPATQEYFHQSKTNKYGLSTFCKKCATTRANKWRLENKDKVNDRRRERIHSDIEFASRIKRLKKESYQKPQNFIRILLANAQKRAIKLNIPCTLTEQDIQIPDKCPLLEIPLMIGQGLQSPSIDRIDNTKGYLPDNIRVISAKANLVKNNLSKEELILFAKNITSYMNMI